MKQWLETENLLWITENNLFQNSYKQESQPYILAGFPAQVKFGFSLVSGILF